MGDISRHVLLQASKGDREAFEMIYKATSDFVYSIALRITDNRDDAEDVTQDVFIKIYKNLNKFRFHSSFKTWVYRITVNTAINAYKEKSKEKYPGGDESMVMSRYAPQMAETVIDKKDNEKLVASLLGILNPDQRACIVLREIEGLNYEEIAEILKVNINTVRSRLKRAREALLAYKKSEDQKNEV